MERIQFSYPQTTSLQGVLRIALRVASAAANRAPGLVISCQIRQER